MVSRKKIFRLSAISLSMLLAGAHTAASPLNLSNLPLVVQTYAPPNIIFLIDTNWTSSAIVAMQISETTGEPGDKSTYDPTVKWACTEGDGKIMLPPSRARLENYEATYSEAPRTQDSFDPANPAHMAIISQWPQRVQDSYTRAQPVSNYPYPDYNDIQYDPDNLEYFWETESESVLVFPEFPGYKWKLSRNAYFPVFDLQRKFWLRHTFNASISTPVKNINYVAHIQDLPEGQDFEPDTVCFFDPHVDPMGWTPDDPYPYYDLIYGVGGNYINSNLLNVPNAKFLYNNVSGNYAGWYLRADNTDPVWSVGSDWKGETKKTEPALGKPRLISRFDALKRAFSDLVDDLVSEQVRARVGLATTAKFDVVGPLFDKDNGAMLKVAVDDLFITNSSGGIEKNEVEKGITQDMLLKSALSSDDLHSGGRTTGQHSALADIAAYFMMDDDGNLPETIDINFCQENETGCEKEVNMREAFALDERIYEKTKPPIFSDSVPEKQKPAQGNTAILEGGFCQKNFVIMMGSGEYNNTDDKFDYSVLHNYLYKKYPNKGFVNPKDLPPIEDNVKKDTLYSITNWATILHDIDLRPDMEGKNNFDVYYIGFIDKTLINQTAEELAIVTESAGGQTFSVSSREDIINSVRTVLDVIEQSSDINSGAIFNSSRISTGSKVFLASYDSSNWTGDLKAYNITTDGTVEFDSPVWSAAQQLDCLAPAIEKSCPILSNGAPTGYQNRNIFTYDGSDGVKFVWNALSESQRIDLGGADQDEDLGTDRIDFLKGAKEIAGRDFRFRQSRLGDIIRSSPVFVGQPSSRIDVDRDPMIYVGANDGMLHGFNADHGYEVFAYIPGALSTPEMIATGEDAANGGLARLTDPDYGHRFYVDLTPTIAEVEIKGTWKTLLVGGTGGGGKGLFALDITNPASFNASNVLWEHHGQEPTKSNSNKLAELGYTFSRPTITKVNHEDGDRWAVITSSGYNSSDTEEARLYVLDAADGKLIKEITVPSDSLSTPTTYDLDGNGTADRVYAGDLEGRMWAFDISDKGLGNWQVAHGKKNAPEPLFTATHQKLPQPITAEPVIVDHPTEQDIDTAPNLLVLFGTGQYLEFDDIQDTNEQSFYAIWDKGASLGGEDPLVARTVTLRQNAQISNTNETISVRTFDDNSSTIDWGTYSGWHIVFNAVPGERFITNGVIRGPFIHFNSMIPDNSVCSTGGTGYTMAACIASGSTSCGGSFNFDVTVDEDGNTATYQPMGIEVSAIPGQSIFIQNQYEDIAQFPLHIPTISGEPLVSLPLRDLTPSKRMSWREMLAD